ncbi:MAG TPA: hypothetical protein VET87_22595 [Rubrivivax sp.]|nr:hypothetical protein [Rubrivivax sp.]
MVNTDGSSDGGELFVAPPTFALLALDTSGQHIVPSKYARDAKMAGLDIITWTLGALRIFSDWPATTTFYATAPACAEARHRARGAAMPRRPRPHPATPAWCVARCGPARTTHDPPRTS